MSEHRPGQGAPATAPDQLSFLPPEDALPVYLLRRFIAEVRAHYDAHTTTEALLGPRLESPADVYALLGPEMGQLRQEQLRVLTLTTKNNLLGVHLVYQGTLTAAPMRLAEVFRPAIIESAASIVVAHNHPSGDPRPSPDDVRITHQIAQAGQLLGIEVLDHIVIGQGRYLSLRERGLMGEPAPGGELGGERF